MKLKDIDLNLLVAFDALMRECHVSRAAEHLDISQSTMSLALAKLRTIFHDPLLIKANNSLLPTERARELWAAVGQVLRNIDMLVHEQAAFDPKEARETVTLIVNDYIDFVVMPELLARLEREAPGIRLRVLGPNPKRLGELMSGGLIDLALSYFPDPPEALRTRPLFQDRLVGIARIGHPILTSEVTVDRLPEYGHLTVEPGEATMYNARLDDALAAHGGSRRVAQSRPTFLGVPFAVAKTDLIAALPERVAKRFVEMKIVEQFELPLRLEPYGVILMWHDRTHNSPVHRWLRTAISGICESYHASI